MEHSFDVETAIRLGMTAAILLDYFKRDKQMPRAVQGATIAMLRKYFPYMEETELREALATLILAREVTEQGGMFVSVEVKQ